MADNTKIGIEITASSSQFQREIQKVVSGAKQAAGSISSAFSGVQRTLGAIGVGLSGAAFIGLIKGSIDAADRLNDLSKATGVSVETLGGIGFAAKQAGSDLESVAKAFGKLNLEIASARGGNQEALKAFEAIGITFKTLQESSPDQVLAKIADAFAGFAGGPEKAALANAFLKKSYQELIPLLDEGGESLRTNIAYFQKYSGVTPELTTKADAFNDSVEKMKLLNGAFGNTLAANLLPSLQALVDRYVEAKEKGDGFAGTSDRIADGFRVIAKGAAIAVSAFIDFGDQLGALAAQAVALARLDFAAVGAIREARQEQSNAARRDLDSLIAAIDNKAAKAGGLSPRRGGGRAPSAGGGGGGRSAAQSEAERYLENLQRQLDRTKDLTVAEQVLSDIQSGRLKLSAGVSQEQLLAVARQIDAANELKKAHEEQLKQMEEEARIRERTSQANTKAIEAQWQEVEQLLEANASLRDEIALIGKDSKAREALAQARLDSAIALKEDTKAMLINAGGSDEQVAAIQQQINLLKERKGLITQQGISEQLLDDAMRIKEINDIFVDSFADALTAVSTKTKSISEAVKDMERQIVASISRIASQKIAESLFGSSGTPGGGQGIFGDIGKWLFSAFGGSAPGFASGGWPAVNKLALVGERGPELFVPRTSGVVVPNDVLTGRRAMRGSTVVQHINVMPGATTKSATQAAMLAGIEAQRALARNG